MRINRQTLDLKPFIEHLLTPYKPLFNERSILLEEVYNTDECFILADADRPHPGSAQPLENCLKYMDTPGRVRVDLSAQPHEVIIAWMILARRKCRGRHPYV